MVDLLLLTFEVVDEPLAAQSDPSLLDLQLRAVTRCTAPNKTLDWISGFSELYKCVNLLAGTGCGLIENGQERQTYILGIGYMYV